MLMLDTKRVHMSKWLWRVRKMWMMQNICCKSRSRDLDPPLLKWVSKSLTYFISTNYYTQWRARHTFIEYTHISITQPLTRRQFSTISSFLLLHPITFSIPISLLINWKTSKINLSAPASEMETLVKEALKASCEWVREILSFFFPSPQMIVAFCHFNVQRLFQLLSNPSMILNDQTQIPPNLFKVLANIYRKTPMIKNCQN